MNDGEELVIEPFQRLIDREELIGYKQNGFWACMDTFKDKQQLDDTCSRSEAPWEVWKYFSKNKKVSTLSPIERHTGEDFAMTGPIGLV